MEYLKGLHGIRALAALLVMFGHIYNATLPPGEEFSSINSYGVTVFFALSGFLITYLLLQENKQTGHIDVIKFYMRRVLRIWPLYFVFVVIVYLYTWTSIDQGGLYYILFIPNLMLITGQAAPPLLGHYWSLGVEEQFYLFWPILVKKSKQILIGLCGFLAGFLILKFMVNLWIGGWSNAYSFIYQTRYDCMAIGGIGGVLYHQRSKWLTWVASGWIQVCSWLVVLVFISGRFHFLSIIDHEILAVVVTALIIGQLVPLSPLVNLENDVFRFIGKISFGIYVFHPLIIDLVMSAGVTEISSTFLRLACCYLSISGLTLAVSWLSYRYMESYFLSLKVKYATPR